MPGSRKNDGALYYTSARSLVREHRHLHAQGFLAAAGTHAPDRRGRKVIATDREAAMLLARELAVRDVHADPAFALDPDLGPGVTRSLIAVAGIDVAAYVARRNARRAAARDEEVGMVLAHPAPHLQGMRRSARHLGDAALVGDRRADALGEREEVGRAILLPQVPPRKLSHRLVRGRERRRDGEDQWR